MQSLPNFGNTAIFVRMNDLKLHLTNWRCFEDNKFKIPDESSVICGENGSGKTSLLSAIFSIYTGRPWLGTKFSESLTFSKEYFGISTQNPNWFLSGKISASGRLTTKYSLPEPKPKTPKFLIYDPVDNYWLTHSRTTKLNILDNLLMQIFGSKFENQIQELNKTVKSKQNLLKHSLETGLPPDKIILKNLTKKIFENSKNIWLFRSHFFDFVNENIEEYRSWIESPLQNWKVKYQISSINSLKYDIQESLNSLNFDLKDFEDAKNNLNFDEIKTPEMSFEKLWQREIASGKVLFGAQRDDFSLISNHLKAEESLSRGEMRLFTLFTKYLAQKIIKENSKNTDLKVWWFLDDVFNEFDKSREKTVFENILNKADFYLATSAKKPDFGDNNLTLKNLTI